MNPDPPTVSKWNLCNNICGFFSAENSYVHTVSLDCAIGCVISVECPQNFPNSRPISKNCEERQVGIDIEYSIGTEIDIFILISETRYKPDHNDNNMGKA